MCIYKYTFLFVKLNAQTSCKTIAPTNIMLLRNGKYSTDIERMLENRRTRTDQTTVEIKFATIEELEDAFVADGFQTRKNMQDLKTVFNKTDKQYLQMLQGFARIYNY